MPTEEEGCIATEGDRADESVPASWVAPDLYQRNLENGERGSKTYSVRNAYQLEQ